jgi:hypothetical protein
MPRFIGNDARVGTQHLAPNMPEYPGVRVKLTYRQQLLLPAASVMCSLDTTDRGGARRYAKRWYRWFATSTAIADCRRSTRNMMDRAGLLGPVAAK